MPDLALIKAGAAVNHAANNGFTALMLAAETGNDLVARVLLEAGARKDLKTRSGETALDIAKRNGHAAICKLLD